MFKVIITFSNGDSHTEEHTESSVIGALQRPQQEAGSSPRC